MARSLADPAVEPKLALLRRAIAEGKLTQQQIADGSGVHQSQVSRILGGKGKRASRNADRLCKYAEAMGPPSGARTPRDELVASLLALWDGTPENADALRSLLNAVGRLGTAR
jgi:transcriptional regulator with XRE-family HTH domain